MLLKYLINMYRKTKIIATVGPSIASKEKIHSAIDTGVNVFRINFSHGSLKEHKQFIDWIRSAKKRVAIMQDIQGPKLGLVTLRQIRYYKKAKRLI